MAAEVLEVCNWLKAKSILIPTGNEWLKSCVQYFKSENPSCCINDIQEFVYDQWLLADLGDIKAGCLPNNCSSVLKVILQGKYAVQINYVVNVAESFYKQLQNLRRPDSTKNLEVDTERVEQQTQQTQTKSKRSLKLEITDGVITICAFEDQPIPKLVEPIAPGMKALIVGPVECRKGVILLKSPNIELIGGEVDTMLISNAVENVLARALGAEENPDPYKSIREQHESLDDEDDEAFAMLADEIENTVSQVSTEVRSGTSTSWNNSHSTQQLQSYSTQTQQMNNVSNSITSDYDLDDDEFAVIAAQTASLAERTNSKMQSKAKTPKLKNQSTLHSFLVPSQNSSAVNEGDSKLNGQVYQELKAGNDNQQTPSILRAQLMESYGSRNNHVINQNQTVSSKNGAPFNRQSIQDTVQNSSPIVVNSSPAYSDAPTVMSEWRPTLNVKPNDALPIHHLDDDKMIVDYLEDDSVVANILKCEANFTQDTQTQPIIPSVSQLQIPFPPKTFPSERTVNASVVKLPQKLSMRDDKWCLSAIIKVKNIELEVDFSSEALDKIFGITAAELKAKKNEVRSNPEMKERINEILKSSQLRIRNLNCKMVIKFSSVIAKPIISDVMES